MIDEWKDGEVVDGVPAMFEKELIFISAGGACDTDLELDSDSGVTSGTTIKVIR